jgi:acetate kinase
MSSPQGPLVAVINAGSSSIKFAVYDEDRRLLFSQLDGLGVRPTTRSVDEAGRSLAPPGIADRADDPAATVPELFSWARRNLAGRSIAAIGHRVVHGGAHHSRPERLTAALLEELQALVPLAPLHQPQCLGPIRAVTAMDPALPQVACFDTAFHRTMPEIEEVYALPQALRDRGVRRYGFHGLSYEYVASALPSAAPELAGGRVVVAHLGNGASLCALRNGVSVATTMGFSALDGVPMGTRCGQLDPGVLLYLFGQLHMAPAETEDLLYRHSGMFALSGISSDFRDLLQSDDPRAAFALDVFSYRVAGEIASLGSALGGLDGLVFTAGVGENAPRIRHEVCRGCRWLGVEIDGAANENGAPRISATSSKVAVYVIPTDENLMISRHVRHVLSADP